MSPRKTAFAFCLALYDKAIANCNMLSMCQYALDVSEQVAIDGQNLEEGGSVAWAPYWGGVQLKQAQLCSKLYPQQLSNGGVLVAFGHVNEYIPCYLGAKETASAVIIDGEIQPSEAFQCFESIRLRVKDQKSVPGWSLTQHEQEEAIPTEKQEL